MSQQPERNGLIKVTAYRPASIASTSPRHRSIVRLSGLIADSARGLLAAGGESLLTGDAMGFVVGSVQDAGLSVVLSDERRLCAGDSGSQQFCGNSIPVMLAVQESSWGIDALEFSRFVLQVVLVVYSILTSGFCFTQPTPQAFARSLAGGAASTLITTVSSLGEPAVAAPALDESSLPCAIRSTSSVSIAFSSTARGTIDAQLQTFVADRSQEATMAAKLLMIQTSCKATLRSL